MSDAVHQITITRERALCGCGAGDFAELLPAMDWGTCPMAWFIDLPETGLQFAFATREDMPLPPMVQNRMAALDMVGGRCADVPGLGAITRYVSQKFAGDATYTLELTQTEYDQLAAELGGESEE